jgi:hypothetical protein
MAIASKADRAYRPRLPTRVSFYAKLNLRTVLTAVALAIALLPLSQLSADACACDGPSTPYLVAHGKSLYGIPWRIRAGEERFGHGGQVTFSFTVGTASEPNDAGYFSTLGLPIGRSFVLTGTKGSGTDPQLEGDISGIASRRAVRLVATMSAGPPLEVEPQIAPSGLRKRHPWLRGLQFFDQWYPSELEVLRLTAYGRSGRVLATLP